MLSAIGGKFHELRVFARYLARIRLLLVASGGSPGSLGGTAGPVGVAHFLGDLVHHLIMQVGHLIVQLDQFLGGLAHQLHVGIAGVAQGAQFLPLHEDLITQGLHARAVFVDDLVKGGPLFGRHGAVAETVAMMAPVSPAHAGAAAAEIPAVTPPDIPVQMMIAGSTKITATIARIKAITKTITSGSVL